MIEDEFGKILKRPCELLSRALQRAETKVSFTIYETYFPPSIDTINTSTAYRGIREGSILTGGKIEKGNDKVLWLDVAYILPLFPAEPVMYPREEEKRPREVLRDRAMERPGMKVEPSPSNSWSGGR